jgi:DNA-binding NarL/FixJ family response regulator
MTPSVGEFAAPHTREGQNVGTLLARPAEPVRVLVVDDQALIREGIVALLHSEPRIEVVGQGTNGQDAIELTELLHPHVVLLDICMPGVDGMQAIREIKARWPKVHVVILTSFAYDDYVIEGLRIGADGYLLKDASPVALMSSIIAVAAGQQVMQPTVGHHVAQLLSQQSPEMHHPYDGLTERELQMVAMIGRGLVAKEIAHELGISEKTVRNHISNIYRKLKVFDRSQIVLYALKKGLAATDLVPAEEQRPASLSSSHLAR